jgi:DNA mismatch endonuclease, patch repair protein
MLLPPTPARARIMRAIRGQGNRTTELALATQLRRHRLSGWRRHRHDLPGRPDFTWARERVAVFVDGCFWHGCPRCYRAPARNSAFWAEKVMANRRRDRRVRARLRSLGWRVLRVWECQVQSDATLGKIRRALRVASER